MRPKVNDFSKSFALEKKFKPNPCKKSSKRHDCNDFKSTYCLKCSYSTRGLALFYRGNCHIVPESGNNVINALLGLYLISTIIATVI